MSSPATPAIEPDGFQAFFDETFSSCDIDKESGTTADMVRIAAGLERCADRRIRALLARLPPEERKALTAGPESRRKSSKSWYPLWSRFIDTACYVEDALNWTRGSERPAGSMRHHLLPDCFSTLTVSALYWLDSYRRNDADGFARRVENEAKSGEKARALQQTLAREAIYYSEHASEDSGFDDACTFLCPLFDADFRKLTRTIETFESSAPALADAMCRSWPDLSRALGGFASCAEKATAYYLVQAGTVSGLSERGEGYYELLAKGEPREVSPRVVPPAKDPDYARFADPLYARCEHDPHDDCLPPETRSACHARELAAEVTRARTSADAGAVRDVERTLRSFTSSLCAVEELAGTALFVTHQRSFGDVQCRWLAHTRASFLFRSWADDDVAAFRRHVAHRESWSQRIASELPRFATGIRTPCPKEPAYASFCRHSWIPAARWKRAERALGDLEPRAKKLGETLCRGWPSLARELGPTCSEKTKSYFLSYGHGLGMLESPEP